MNWRPNIDPEQRANEDHRAQRTDTRIARLGAKEIVKWIGDAKLDAYDMWIIVTRIKALLKNGATVDEVLRRLTP